MKSIHILGSAWNVTISSKRAYFPGRLYLLCLTSRAYNKNLDSYVNLVFFCWPFFLPTGNSWVHHNLVARCFVIGGALRFCVWSKAVFSVSIHMIFLDLQKLLLNRDSRFLDGWAFSGLRKFSGVSRNLCSSSWIGKSVPLFLLYCTDLSLIPP